MEFHTDGEAFSPQVEDARMISIEYEGPWRGEGNDGEEEIDENSICYHINYATEFKMPSFKNELEFDSDGYDIIYAWVNIEKQFVELIWPTQMEKNKWKIYIKNLHSYFSKYDDFDALNYAVIN